MSSEINDEKIEMIECPKCFGPNAITNDYCTFCKAKLDKSRKVKERIEDEYDDDDEEISVSRKSAFESIFSFLIPIVGFIYGSIMMAKEDDNSISIGRRCTVLATISMVISSIIIFAIYSNI